MQITKITKLQQQKKRKKKDNYIEINYTALNCQIKSNQIQPKTKQVFQIKIINRIKSKQTHLIPSQNQMQIKSNPTSCPVKINDLAIFVKAPCF
jgi:hypothetical protein